MLNIEIGSYIKHPKMDWGIGLIESKNKEMINVLFEKEGYKILSLKHVTPILLTNGEQFEHSKEVVKILTSIFDYHLADIHDGMSPIN